MEGKSYEVHHSDGTVTRKVELKYNPASYLNQDNFVEALVEAVRRDIIDKVVDDLFIEFKKNRIRDKLMQRLSKEIIMKKNAGIVSRSR